MAKYSDKNIVDAWFKNAGPWITAVRDNEIESRYQVTDRAIIDAILRQSPETVLDIGCGEGWLARELNNAGISTLGIDVVPELVNAASNEGGGRFSLMSYEDLARGMIREKFDVIVCNFSLLGSESVTGLFKQVPSMLNDGGRFIIQTIHPVSGCGDAEYNDGWREGSWAGFSDKFTDPAPWYFRTLETWKSLFQLSGFTLGEILEPVHPETRKMASIIFIGEIAAGKTLNQGGVEHAPHD